jgi:hypothetical protein
MRHHPSVRRGGYRAQWQQGHTAHVEPEVGVFIAVSVSVIFFVVVMSVVVMSVVVVAVVVVSPVASKLDGLNPLGCQPQVCPFVLELLEYSEKPFFKYRPLPTTMSADIMAATWADEGWKS